MEKPIRKTIRIDPRLYDRICDSAEIFGIGISDLMNLLVWRALGPLMAMRYMYDNLEHVPQMEPRESDQIERKKVNFDISRTLFQILNKRMGSAATWNTLVCELMKLSIGAIEAEATFYSEVVATERYVREFVKWRESNPGGSPKAFDEHIRRILSAN